MNSDLNPPTSTPRYFFLPSFLPPYSKRTTSSLSMSTTHHSEPATMATGTAPKRLRFDLFTEHVDNTHSEACYQMAFNTFNSFPTSLPNLRIDKRMEWRIDLMARAWETQGKSTVKLPGQAANRCWRITCMRWIFFNSTEGLWQEDWARRRIRRILLARRQDVDYISGISEGQCRHGTVKTSMRSGKTSDMVFLNELKPSDVLQKIALRSKPTRTMDVWRYKASNGRASPVYQPWGPWLLRGGGSVTSVPLTHHSALWLAGLGGGIPYYIMPPSHLHSSVALLSSFYLTHTGIAPMLVLTFSSYYNIELSHTSLSF
ncbi:hypothetical protein HO173_001505 [Letharia columbiana]|uniref:Uncharacterized protein n=1 Tax=Letharia columbiana TaxID=112416 RepID=A0A8H6G3L2_9LECA|nr:uncharacterized protein HO173_001505 [Letharia columbiana]KAF6239897.1 hypothetical protein HO173_001505 [Letharia columbiana]